jgi:MoxR-like ATPase
VWLRRVDPASVVTDIVAKTPTPASGAMPSYGIGQSPPSTADDAQYRYSAPPRS